MPVFALLLSLTLANVQQSPASQGLPEPQANNRPYTLHVYEDRIQLAAFVLNSLLGPERDLTPRDFRLRLDSGPPFHPLHVRVQADDAMSLEVVVDASNELGPALMTALDTSAPTLPQDVFGPADTLSVSALDCDAGRTITTLRASVGNLRSQLATALPRTGPYANYGLPPTCPHLPPLWDLIAAAALHLQHAPGHRVVVVLSDGFTGPTRSTWEQVHVYASRLGVTVVGIRPRYFRQGRGTGNPQFLLRDQEQPFALLCSGTGGIVLNASTDTVWSQFWRMVGLLKSRYILDFQRPQNEAAGIHDIGLTVRDRHALVRISGTGLPLASEQLRQDPSTVPTDNSQAPLLGNRKILSQPNTQPSSSPK